MDAYQFVELHSDDETDPKPRFAAQRIRAAKMRRMPERMILNRARSEGEAHRRSESAERAALSESN